MEHSSTRRDEADPSAMKPEEWVEKYGDKLFGYALQATQDRHLAEDLVQEPFLAALRSKDTFQGLSQESTWLFGILKHKILDSMRKKSRSLEDAMGDDEPEPEQALFQEDGTWKVPPGKWNLNPSQAFERREFLQMLRKCLQSLSKGLSQVYTLRDILGCSSQEVCEALNIQPNNLWTRMHRARASLRQCLERNWFESG